MPLSVRALAETLEPRRLYAATFPFTFGGSGFNEVTKVVQGGDGSLYVTGLFSGTTNFARRGQTAVNLTARGDTDIFVARYRADGGLVYATQIGGDYTNSDLRRFTHRDVQISQQRFSRYVGKIGQEIRNVGEYANDIAVDASGNVYLAGAFRESIRAGRTVLTADHEYTDNYYDALVTKIDAAGRVTWAEKFGGGFDDDALSVGLDKAGNAYVGGYFSRTANFGTGGVVRNLQTDGRDGGFVLKLTPAGSYVWAYSYQSDAIGTDERNSINDIAVTGSGEVYFAGTYAREAKFNGRRGFALDSRGKTDAVLGKINRKGQFLWAEGSGGDGYDGNSSLTLDSAGNVYTAGYFSGRGTDLNPLPNVEQDYSATPRGARGSPEFSDLVISKFTSSGTPRWISTIGGGYIELAADISIGANGNVYTAGSFFNTVDFAPGRQVEDLSSTATNDGSIKDNNTDFGRNESYDWFVSELSSSAGRYVAATQIGMADDDYAGGLTQLAGGNILVYGRTVDSTVPDRGDRHESAAIYALAPDLTSVSST